MITIIHIVVDGDFSLFLKLARGIETENIANSMLMAMVFA